MLAGQAPRRYAGTVPTGRLAVTTRNVITIFLLIVLIFAADALWFHWGLPVFVGKQFVGFVEYLSFWR